MYDLLIIGGGPSGLTAAIYSSRASLKTLVLAGDPPGGQLMWTTEVENFPGFINGITGPELIGNMRSQAERFGVKLADENVVNVKGDAKSGFKISTESGAEYTGRSIIIASGASAKWLGIESEQRLRGHGVSACATCDGFFFKGKDVVVVGGGDAAMEEATFITKYASRVYVLVRSSKEDMRASKIMQQRAFANEKLTFMFNSEIAEIIGEKSVESAKVKNLVSGEISDVKAQGVFVAIGHKPNTDFLKGFVELDHVGYVKVIENTRTTTEGVFVSGDVADFRYRQAISAAGFGCMAALDAEKFLAGH